MPGTRSRKRARAEAAPFRGGFQNRQKQESGKRMEGERLAAANKAGRSARPFGGTPIVPPGLGLRPAGQDHSAATQRRPHSEPRPAARSLSKASPRALRGGGAQVARSFAGWQNDAPACAGGGRVARRGSAEPGYVPSGASAPRGYIVTSDCRSSRERTYSGSKWVLTREHRGDHLELSANSATIFHGIGYSTRRTG